VARTSTKAKSDSAKQSKTSTKKRAQTPSEKATRKSARAASASEPAPLLDDSAQRTIAAIVCAVAALVLAVIVLWPTDAIVASMIATGLKRVLGLGAILLPIVLAIIAATFIIQFDKERVPTRVTIGLALIYLAILVLLALFTPGAEQNPSGVLFAPSALELRGGYIGAGIAWVGLSSLGLAASAIVWFGVIAAGLVVIGLSVNKLMDTIREKRAAFAAREEQEYGVLEDDNLMLQPTPRPRARTQAAADSTRPLDDRMPARSSSGRIPAQSSGRGTTQQLTRKLGQKNEDSPVKPQKASSGGVTMPVQRDTSEEGFKLPDFSLLKVSKQHRQTKAFENELADTAARLQQTMEDFGIMATVVDWIAGPTVTLFEVDLPPGVRVNRITALNDDIALALAAPGVRIFAPIPGTHYVGIEVPNAKRENVLLGDVLKEVHGGPLSIAIGKDVEGNAIIEDLAKMPHILIGGTTGSGKSVGINAMIMSMLMRATPDEVRFIMIDPKRVEFAPYADIPHLYVPVVTEPKEAASALAWGVAEMELRLKTYSKVGAKNIGSYNQMVREGKIRELIDNGTVKQAELPQSQYIETPMPYIVIVIDELADLMMNVGKEVEFSISRIAQLARAAGIHLIVATQRPSANVVTGLIKANITTRIAFNVASGLDSRVILDTSGAESLIGNGDLLLSKPELGRPLRVQGCFTSDEEIAAVVEAVKSQGEPEYHSEILKTNIMSLGDTQPDGSGGSVSADDPLIWEAAEIVVASGLGSTSNIQRKLKVGYSRAGRIMDMLEEKGVVGPPNGSKPREVLVDAMELETLKAFEQNDGDEF